MMNKTYIACAIVFVLSATILAVPPTIRSTTVWPDTTYSGPFAVRCIVSSDDYPLQDTLLYYKFNPDIGEYPPSWSDFSPPDSVHGDTMFFHVPAIPIGMMTPVKTGYAIYASNTNGESALDPSSVYHTFLNKVYSPKFSNVTIPRDTFFNGPYIIRTQLTTAYGDTIASSSLYCDIEGGANYLLDSVGGNGYYYYHIPRCPGNSQTPVTVLWNLVAFDTLGNWGNWPVRGDSINHFSIIDPKPSGVRTLGNIGQPGPFPVWVTYGAEGGITNDSLWYWNGAEFTPVTRDSVGSLALATYYYTIPQQATPIVSPILTYWYLKATDAATNNSVCHPYAAPGSPNSFYIYDWTPPTLTGVTRIGNTSEPGTYPVYATCRDTSGVYQMRLYYRYEPDPDTAWRYSPMFPTSNPDEYRAYLPADQAGTLVKYYVQATDGAQTETGALIRNKSYFPAGGPLSPWHFFIGDHPRRVLLVNDELPSNSYEGAYISSLDTTGIIYGYWDNRKADVLPALGNFNTLIWFTGEDSVNTLGQTDRDSLAAFLSRGGNLLICSKNLGQDIGDTSVFYHDYLKAQYYSNRSTQSFLRGRNAYPISDGVVDTLLVSGSAELTRSIDVIVPLPGADSVFTFRTIGRCGVIRCSTETFKTVYSTVPVEGLTKNSNGRLSRTYFIARCLKYFGMTVFYKVEGEPAASVPAQGMRLSPASPNPFRQRTMIRFQLPAAARVRLKVYTVTGQLVRTLVDRPVPAGDHSISWNGADDQGRQATNGVYFYRLSDGEREMTGKVLIIR